MNIIQDKGDIMKMTKKKVLVLVGVVVFIILAVLIFWIGSQVDELQKQKILVSYIRTLALLS